MNKEFHNLFPQGSPNTVAGQYFSGASYLCPLSDMGYYQEWGKSAQELNPGDVVNIPPEVKHWHGAAPDSWFAHIAISVPVSKAEWLEPVDEAEYTKLK